MSLVATFFATFDSKQEGLNFLNAELDTNYMHGHLSRWERGERDPGGDARAVMLKRVLPEVLRKHGQATPADVRAALKKLT